MFRLPRAGWLYLFVGLTAFLLVSVPAGARAEAAERSASALAISMEEGLGVQTFAWSASDQAWLRTNRRIAIAGKVLTVIGRLGLVSSILLGAGFNNAAYWVFLALGNGGELTWSGCDLRATKRLLSRGLRVRRGAAVTSLLGALTFAPVTWIAGPIASMRIRDANLLIHGRKGLALDAYGASLSLHF